jgi:hypothetical protein
MCERASTYLLSTACPGSTTCTLGDALIHAAAVQTRGPARSPNPPKRHTSHAKDLSSFPFLASAGDLFSIIGYRSPIRASLPSPASLAPSSVPSILGLGEGSPHCKQAFSHSGGCGLAGGTASWLRPHNLRNAPMMQPGPALKRVLDVERPPRMPPLPPRDRPSRLQGKQISVTRSLFDEMPRPSGFEGIYCSLSIEFISFGLLFWPPLNGSCLLECVSSLLLFSPAQRWIICSQLKPQPPLRVILHFQQVLTL